MSAKLNKQLSSTDDVDTKRQCWRFCLICEFPNRSVKGMSQLCTMHQPPSTEERMCAEFTGENRSHGVH